MAEIKPYQQRISPEGTLSARATGDAFGAQIARAKMMSAEALQSAGQGLERAGNMGLEYISQQQKLQEVVDRDQANLWATTTYYSHLQKTQEAINNTSLTPQDPAFKDFTDKTVKDATDTFLAAADNYPNEFGKEYLTKLAPQLMHHVWETASSHQAQMASLATKDLAKNVVSQASTQVSSNPTNETYKSTVDTFEKTINNVQGAPAPVRLQIVQDGKREIAKAHITAAIMRDPAGFLKSVHPTGGRVTPNGIRNEIPTTAPVMGESFRDFATNTGLTEGEAKIAFAVYGQESSYGTNNATSSAGARGHMQIMPGTFNALKKAGLLPPEADINNPDDALRGGMLEMQRLYRKYEGNVDQTLAAYYGGEGAVNSDGTIKTWRSSPGAPNVGQYIEQVKRRIYSPDSPTEHANASGLPSVEPLPETTIVTTPTALEGWDELSPDEKVAAVRTAEQNMANNLREARESLTRDINDRESQLRNGIIPGDLNDPKFSQQSLITAFGEDQGRRVFDTFNYMKSAAGIWRGMETRTPEETAKMLKEIEPQPDSFNYAAHHEVYHRLEVKYQGILEKFQAEARSAHTQEAQDMNAKVTDLVSALRDGQNPTIGEEFSTDRLKQVFGDMKGSLAADTIAYAGKVGKLAKTIAEMPTAQANAELSNLEPHDTFNHQERHQLYSWLFSYAKGNADQRAKDPAAWMIQHGIGGAKPLSQDLTQMADGIKARVSGSSLMGKLYGIDADYLTKDESNGLRDAIVNQSPTEQVATLASLREAFSPGDPSFANDSKFNKLMGQIAPKDAPMIGYVAGLITRKSDDGKDGSEIAKRILAGEIMLRGDRMGVSGQNAGASKISIPDFDLAFRDVVQDTFKNMHDPQRGADLENAVRQATLNYLAATYQGTADNTLESMKTDTVKKAFDMVTGGVGQANQSRVLIPWGVKPNDFADNFPIQANGFLNSLYQGDSAAGKLENYIVESVGDGQYMFRMGATHYALDPRTHAPAVMNYRRN